ncbi:MAG: PDZ domain-containing protein [Planctomycetes bacterium]|nr:PDZ domain-containing protein [Planctomycetota bacterium]
MKRITVLLAALALASASGAVSSQSGERQALREALDFAKAKIYPALVNISVVSARFSSGRTTRVGGAGSGTIISPAGHVLTNYHVARDATRIVCTLTSGEQIPADIVGDDPATDLSVLKLRLHERKDPTRPLPFAMLGDSDRLDVGDSVIAVGNPLSLSSSMTLGIVSNPRRVFTRGDEIQEFDFGAGSKTGMFTVWIQHDALILPGNSGGPLVNLQGEVVGVNTRGGSGYGFATPANLVKRVVNQILTFGEVRRGWLGMSFLPVAKLDRETGALVATVDPESPAEAAGIRPGDVLLALDGQVADCRFLEQVPVLYATIADMPAGKKVQAEFVRGGERLAVELTVAPMADFVGTEEELTALGITVQNITVPMAREHRYPDTRGVLLTGVRGGQVFEEAKPPIRAGDVILEVDGTAIVDIAAFAATFAAAREQNKEEVGVVYRRDREILVTLVKLDKDKPRKPGGELPKAWLGVNTQVLTPKVAQALGLEGRRGFRITEVYPWTKAHAAGFETGDLLIAFDGEPLKASRPQDARDLRNLVEDRVIGETVEVTVLRGGEEKKLEVELEESPASALDAKTAENETFEFIVRELTFMDRIERKLAKDQQGVLVTEVASGGWASVAGLPKNSILMALNDQPVTDVASFRRVMKEVEDSRCPVVKVFVQRGHRTSFVFIEPDWTRKAAARTEKK